MGIAMTGFSLRYPGDIYTIAQHLFLYGAPTDETA